MSRPRFMTSVVVGLALCVLASIAHPVFYSLFAWSTASALLITMICGGYITFLLSQTPHRNGRVITVFAWLALTAVGLLFSWPAYLFLASQLVAIWMVRALYFHSSLLTAGADLGLILLGAGAAFWAFLHTGSLFLALWCFFLLQALFAFAPAWWKRRTCPAVANAEPDTFDQARRQAEAALNQLVTR